MALNTGWWRYSEARTEQRDEGYTESARGLRRVVVTLQNVALAVMGRRRWKPPRISAGKYTVEDNA